VGRVLSCLGSAFATRRPSEGRLPWRDYLVPPTDGPGANCAFRLAQVLGASAVPASLAAALRGAPGPILLTDDLAAIRWTLTVKSGALQLAGA
jgi:hypothetical protein